ncbi:MAG: hypothetical protein ACYC64_04645 [Armatimonadota bacterium]
MKRHTRAYVREQRSRWIRKRIGQIRREWCDLPEQKDVVQNWHRPLGSLSKKDPWDCGRTQCGICRNWGQTPRYIRERAVADCELFDMEVRLQA